MKFTEFTFSCISLFHPYKTVPGQVKMVPGNVLVLIKAPPCSLPQNPYSYQSSEAVVQRRLVRKMFFKNFAKLAGKCLCWSFYFRMLQAESLQLY